MEVTSTNTPARRGWLKPMPNTIQPEWITEKTIPIFVTIEKLKFFWVNKYSATNIVDEKILKMVEIEKAHTITDEKIVNMIKWKEQELNEFVMESLVDLSLSNSWLSSQISFYYDIQLVMSGMSDAKVLFNEQKLTHQKLFREYFEALENLPQVEEVDEKAPEKLSGLDKGDEKAPEKLSRVEKQNIRNEKVAKKFSLLKTRKERVAKKFSRLKARKEKLTNIYSQAAKKLSRGDTPQTAKPEPQPTLAYIYEKISKNTAQGKLSIDLVNCDEPEAAKILSNLDELENVMEQAVNKLIEFDSQNIQEEEQKRINELLSTIRDQIASQRELKQYRGIAIYKQKSLMNKIHSLGVKFTKNKEEQLALPNLEDQKREDIQIISDLIDKEKDLCCTHLLLKSFKYDYTIFPEMDNDYKENFSNCERTYIETYEKILNHLYPLSIHEPQLSAEIKAKLNEDLARVSGHVNWFCELMSKLGLKKIVLQ